eukprot:363062-Chlamydomonas_euryale.AAC.16
MAAQGTCWAVLLQVAEEGQHQENRTSTCTQEEGTIMRMTDKIRQQNSPSFTHASTALRAWLKHQQAHKGHALTWQRPAVQAVSCSNPAAPGPTTTCGACALDLQVSTIALVWRAITCHRDDRAVQRRAQQYLHNSIANGGNSGAVIRHSATYQVGPSTTACTLRAAASTRSFSANACHSQPTQSDCHLTDTRPKLAGHSCRLSNSKQRSGERGPVGCSHSMCM